MTVVLVGPTAAGKSRLALALADRFHQSGRGAEIVNADSMLVYSGMDIGTAKPTPAERAATTHHLIDILDVRQTATVADFQRLARAVITECRSREVVPIVVGGSALYVRAIIDDFEFPGTDPAVRSRLEADLDDVGSQALHARLARFDPAAARQLEPQNARRVIRALEVIELTGRPYAAQLPAHRYALADVVQIGLQIARPELDVRIEERVATMWRDGLIEEVRSLLEHGLNEGQTAQRGLGYRQVLSFLRGEITEEQAQGQTVIGTRKFARRQDSWFGKDPRISWLDYDRTDLVEAAYALTGPDGNGGHQQMKD